MDLTFDSIFWFCALLGSLLFVLRIFLMFFGVSDEFSGSGDGVDPEFKIFSLYTMTGFFMMFGWGGLAAYMQFGFSWGASLFFAFCSGSAMLFATKILLRGVKKLISTGDKYILEDAVGKVGTVYYKIPAKGCGKVHVSIGDLLRELPASSLNDEEIDSFTKVRIVKISGDFLIVEKWKDEDS